MPTRLWINKVIFAGVARPKTKKSVRNQTVVLSVELNLISSFEVLGMLLLK